MKKLMNLSKRNPWYFHSLYFEAQCRVFEERIQLFNSIEAAVLSPKSHVESDWVSFQIINVSFQIINVGFREENADHV